MCDPNAGQIYRRCYFRYLISPTVPKFIICPSVWSGTGVSLWRGCMKSLNQHLLEIRSGGWEVIQGKVIALLKKLTLLIHAVWAVPVVLIIRCIRPWRIVRFGMIDSSRIGSFAIEVGQMWAMCHQQSGKYLDLYWFNKPLSNEFWAEMTRRNFPVYFWVRPLDIWNRIIPGGVTHNYPFDVPPDSRDIIGWLEESEKKMEFLPSENARGKAWLRKQGWKDGDSFVCLLVRDSSYLDNTYPNTDPSLVDGTQYNPKHGYGWNHLNYRDSDIATYVPAAEWLADQGVWVLRMGKVMAKPIPCSHPRIIDYPFHPEKNDFQDIWLFANCDLCITTLTGPDIVSDIYRRPLLLVNYLPFRYLFSWSNAMHIPKTLVWQESEKPLNLRELIKYHSEYYDRIGIRIIDLTPEEITSAVQERWQRLQGTWTDTDEDHMRYNQFWDIVKADPEFLHASVHIKPGWIHPESRAGAIWLRSKGNDFFR